MLLDKREVAREVLQIICICEEIRLSRRRRNLAQVRQDGRIGRFRQTVGYNPDIGVFLVPVELADTLDAVGCYNVIGAIAQINNEPAVDIEET